MNLRVSLRNSMPTLLEVSVTLSDSESTAALGFAESWGPASRSADGHSSLHYLHWIFWNAWRKKCRISSEECLRSGRRNTSERIERTYSTPKEVIGALFFFSLSEMFWPKTHNLLNLSLTQFLICCVWRFVASDAVRFSGIGASLMIFLHGTCAQETTNETQRIGISVFSDLQTGKDRRTHQDTSSDRFTESEDLDGKPSETATVWKRSRKCRRVAWKKELQRFIGTSLGVKWQIRENQKQNCQSWSKTDQTQLECIFM